MPGRCKYIVWLSAHCVTFVKLTNSNVLTIYENTKYYLDKADSGEGSSEDDEEGDCLPDGGMLHLLTIIITSTRMGTTRTKRMIIVIGMKMAD